MISVKEQSFIQGKEQLLAYKEETMYINSFVKYEYMRYSRFRIAWFYEENTLIGYALMGIVASDFFDDVDDNEFLSLENKNYLYIPYFEIFESYQQRGFGKACVNWLKNRFSTLDMMVYATDDSYVFWEYQGFECQDGDWWYKFCHSAEVIAS
ncbi:GNAT family N-acetyltransferase (plasmid) [Aneurinibacillus sp. Ricciae_BoGa-3]|uniref:GNAT family N-acetyltransferase n=1 Tax=Aneurinibacillus sp. Ricciae_BoGa-3 TaxID=3022697 RepID=UPI00233F8A29|nr:GNAT family N-acetyltransferase [Aneurinibacillus sp. Ricciae_BoGa-3]WCK57331.1 GNAT family N-acetyltransferase [Aneurinibacillus sp. Ricciae_BoGa-3]